MAPNPDFLSQVKQAFPEPAGQVVVVSARVWGGGHRAAGGRCVRGERRAANGIGHGRR